MKLFTFGLAVALLSCQVLSSVDEVLIIENLKTDDGKQYRLI